MCSLHINVLQILPKDGAAGRRTRGSGRAGRGIVLAKVKKELDVLQRSVLSAMSSSSIATVLHAANCR